MKQKRKSNFELLRIIAILLIISFHYVYKSEYNFQELNYNSFIVKMFYFFGELGVNLFVLITGYFLVNGKFSMKKLIKLILEISFYFNASMFLLMLLVKGNLLIAIKILYYALVINIYWFATAYILLYIISPYLNILIHNMKKGEYQKLLIIAIFIWSIIPTFLVIINNSTEEILYFNRFIWLVIMYLLGAYMRKYSIKIFNKLSNTIIIALSSFLIMILSIFVIYYFKGFFAKIGITEVAFLWHINSFPMLILAVSIFEIFAKIDIGYNKVINKIASTTFGIYLLHDGVLCDKIWAFFRTKQCLNSKFSILYIIATTAIIFVCGAIVDLIRQFIEKYTVDKVLDSKVYEKVKNTSKEVAKEISEKVL